VVVFCLALMGTDYPSFLKEATRVLRPGGKLWIAEVRSRFVQGGQESFEPFLTAIQGTLCHAYTQSVMESKGGLSLQLCPEIDVKPV